MYNNICTLISEVKSTDEFGNVCIETTERQIFCEVRSIGQSEFYQAAAAGFKPEIKLVFPDFLEYNGEKFLKFADFDREAEIYKIVRTYRAGNELEVVCQRGVDE